MKMAVFWEVALVVYDILTDVSEELTDFIITLIKLPKSCGFDDA